MTIMIVMKEIIAPVIFRIIMWKLSPGWRRSWYRNCQIQDMSFVGVVAAFLFLFWKGFGGFLF